MQIGDSARRFASPPTGDVGDRCARVPATTDGDARGVGTGVPSLIGAPLSGRAAAADTGTSIARAAKRNQQQVRRSLTAM